MSSSGSKDASRRDNFDTSTVTGDKDKLLEAEVERICKKGMPTPADAIALSDKYGNDVFVEKVLKMCAKNYKRILRKAEKVANKVRNKFESGRLSLHEILDKMTRYKKDNNWSDAQYSIFTTKLTEYLSGKQTLEIDNNQDLIMNRSRINRMLGRPVTNEGSLKIKESEHKILADILSLYETSLSLYNSSMLTSMTYNDLDLLAMTGDFNRGKHIPSNHIHPVIACMFLPKFELFEYHMIYSNIGRIIKARNEGKPIIMEPDAYLYGDMISDPNDVVCDADSPITDVRNRFRVQTKLWKTVQQLRAGLYYEDTPISEFISALNTCRNNLYDNADLAYNQDEGSILRRIMSVFSLRPIMVATTPLAMLSGYMNYGMAGMAGNQFGIPSRNMGFNNQPISTITSIPMITLQLAPEIGEIDLQSGLKQTLWINENKTIVPKEQKIIYTREICIFYINRRTQQFQIKTFSNPLLFSQLPLTLSSSAKVNTSTVNVTPAFKINDEEYLLRSVVALTDTSITQSGSNNFVKSFVNTGCVGLFMKHMDQSAGTYDNEYFRYDPVGAAIPRKLEDGSGHILNKPIHRIQGMSIDNLDQDADDLNRTGFFDIAATRGTLYFYAKTSGYSRENTILSI